MARVSDFLVDVRPSAAEAPTPSIESEIRRGVIELCRESQIWRQEVGVELVEGKTDYQLRVTGEGRADNVLKALYIDDDNRQMVLQKGRHGDFVAGRESQFPLGGPPRYFTVLPDGAAIRIHPIPDSSGSNPRLIVYTTVVPSRRARTIPDFIANKHHDAIVAFAKWRLLVIPDKPWTDPRMAEYHRRQFYRGVNQARREALSEQWAPTQVKLRRWV